MLSIERNKYCAFLLLLLLQIRSVCAEEVRLGILTDLSSGMASWGRQTALGAEIAKDEIQSAGGSLQLFIADHQLNTTQALSEFQALTAVNRVQAVYSEFTPTTLAIAPLTESKSIPMIYSAAATSALRASPYIFKSYLDYVQGCKLIAEQWKAIGITKVAMLKANLEFGELCEAGLQEVFEDAVIATYDPGSEVATQVLRLKDAGAQAVLNTTFEPDFLRMLKAMSDLRWHPELGIQRDAIGVDFPPRYKEQLRQTWLFALPPLPSQFLEKVRARDPQYSLVSIDAAGLAYLHIRQLYAAVRQCKDPTAKCITAAIESAPSDSITGFRGWRNHIADFAISVQVPQARLKASSSAASHKQH